MHITKDEAVEILGCISFAASEGQTTLRDLSIAKRMIEHFHINDFGWLLTEYDGLEDALNGRR